jgi:hypothetical protein
MHRIRELLSLLDGMAHGLFEIHVFALVHGFEGDLGVPVVGRRNDYRVDVGPVDHFAIIQESIALQTFGILAFAFFIDIAHGHYLTVVGPLADPCKGTRQIRTAAAYTNHTDVNPVVGADYPSGGWLGGARRKCFGGHPQRRTDACRFSDEVSTIRILTHDVPFCRIFPRPTSTIRQG